MKIGYIGVGAMGAPMIAQLAKVHGSDVLIFDINEAAASRVAEETGATVCQTIVELAREVDFLFSCVPNNDSIRQVYLGEGGVTTSISPGAVTIDCSTVGPDATREVYQGLKEVGASH